MAAPLQIEVVSGDGIVWQGEGELVVVRTTEGDLGILANHEPVLAALVPGAAEIVTPDGRREVVAIEGGFLSVFENRVSLLSDSAEMGSEVSLDRARTELARLQEIVDAGNATDEDTREHRRLISQVKAGEKFAQLKR